MIRTTEFASMWVWADISRAASAGVMKMPRKFDSDALTTAPATLPCATPV